jgi:hypothetical protein
MKIQKVLPALLLTALLAQARAETISFQREVSPNTSYNGATTRLIRSDQASTVDNNMLAMNVGGLATGAKMRGLLSFSINAIPAGSQITKVSLLLYIRSVDSATIAKDLAIDLRVLTQPFTGSQVTWNNAATGAAWTAPGGDYGDLLKSVSVNTKSVADTSVIFTSSDSFITAAQAALDAGEPLGMILLASVQESLTDRAFVLFRGNSETTPALRPKLVIEYKNSQQVRNSEHFLPYANSGDADISTVTKSDPVTLQYSLEAARNPDGFFVGWKSEEWWLPSAPDFKKLRLKYKVDANAGDGVRLVVKAYRRVSGTTWDYWRKEILLTETTPDFSDLVISAADTFIASSENNPAWEDVNHFDFTLVGDAGDSITIQFQSPGILNESDEVVTSLWQEDRTVDGGADIYNNLPQFFRRDSDNDGVSGNLADGRGLFLIGRGGSILESEAGRNTLVHLKAGIGNFGIAANVGFPSLSGNQKWLQDNLAGVVYQQGGAYGLSEYITEAQGWLTSPAGDSRNITPGFGDLTGAMKYFDLGSPAIWSAFDKLLDRVGESRIREFQLVETYWPSISGREGFWGFGESELVNLRTSLNASDTADFPVLNRNGTPVAMSFWDYFESRHGFRWDPADLGYAVGWTDFLPPPKRGVGLINAGETQEQKRYQLMVTLAAYQVIKFYQRVGRSAYETNGRKIKLSIIPNGNNYDNSFDSLAYQSGKYPHVVGYEYFGNPKNFTAYERGPVLRRMYARGDTADTPKEQRIITETSVGGGGNGEPYWAPEVAYATIYDLMASQEADSIENDWLNWVASEVSNDNPKVKRRYNDFAAKALAFNHARQDGSRRPLAGETGTEGFFGLLETKSINNIRLEPVRQYQIGQSAARLRHPMLSLDIAQIRGLGNFDKIPDILVDDLSFHLPEDITWLGNWLKESDGHVLVAHGFALGKKPDGANYYEGWTSAYYALNAADQATPLLGASLQESGAVAFANTAVSAQGEWAADARFAGLAIDGSVPVYTYTPADNVLISANGTPLVSKRQVQGDDSQPKGVVYYLHFRPGKVVTKAIEEAVLAKILDEKLKRDFLAADETAAPLDDYKLRRYRTGSGIAVTAYHPHALDNFNFAYDATATQFLPFADEDSVGAFKVRLPGDMPLSGENTVIGVDMLSGEQFALPVDEIAGSRYVTLSLAGVSCGLWQIVGTNQGAADALTSRAVETGEIAFGAVPTPPYITANLPATQQVEVGEPITLSVRAGGTQPLLYQWMKGGQPIEGATSSTFSIASAQPGNGGRYHVVVSNGIGDPAISVATLVSVGDYVIPDIIEQPVANQTVVDGGSASITAVVTGNPTPTLAWQVSSDGTNWTGITPADATGLYTISADGTTLTIINANASLNGLRYRYIATNDADTVVSAVTTLTVATAIFSQPAGLVFDDAGNLYVSDAALHTIHVVANATAAAPSGSTLAGTSGAAGVVNTTGTAAQFNTPRALHIYGGTLIVADSGNSILRNINTTTGNVATYAGPLADLYEASGIASDSIGVVVADTKNHVIRRRNSVDVATAFAGVYGQAGFVDGPGTDAKFNNPSAIAYGADGKYYIADTGNSAIRVLARTGGGWEVTTLADADDGLNAPRGLVASGSGANMVIYIADTGNSLISQITMDGTVTPIAGYAGIDEISGIPGFKDGTGGNAWFDRPEALTIGPDQNLYVADTGNGVIRKITFNELDKAVVTTLTISGQPPPAPPPLPEPAGSHDSGGGALGTWFWTGLALLACIRALSQRRA